MATTKLQGQSDAGRFRRKGQQFSVSDAQQESAQVEFSEREENVRGSDQPEEGAAVHEEGERDHGRGKVGRAEQAGRTQHAFVCCFIFYTFD